ncbi:MarP family serine protease [Mycobacteroides salmoniphilum]|uniref:Serine protease n=1 Tax=Mycobacteroides salmoniphilum TaxID=404941 RepID=A0A4R8SKA3_9MYCO|nr:MarP family serine protease [Mycobacteroides salmoniphilum]TDZ97624.1 Serine protease [Mycobacteroides salmoniphilum]TEA01854.1 Serine protease [Mycobacteroides salmoniphilum]
MGLSVPHSLDLVFTVVLVVASLLGWRLGTLGSIMSFVGLGLGAVSGTLLAPHLVGTISGTNTRFLASLTLIAALAVVGQVAGIVLGQTWRSRVQHRSTRLKDSAIGLLLHVAVVLIAVWTLLTPASDADHSRLAVALRESPLLSQVNKWAPPVLKEVPGDVARLLNHADTAEAAQPSPNADVPVLPPDPDLRFSAAVPKSEPSVVKINAVAHQCLKSLEGSGFVVAPQRVMSNAHVVAGTDRVTVESSGRTLEATVISYDPEMDLSILDVPGLTAPPLPLTDKPGKTGDNAIILGYPGGGNYAATPARIREIFAHNGPDIYESKSVTRQMYSLRGTVRQGNSGGPLIDATGRVLGIVFGAAKNGTETGYALTANEIRNQITSTAASQPADTGSCTTSGH